MGKSTFRSVDKENCTADRVPESKPEIVQELAERLRDSEAKQKQELVTIREDYERQICGLKSDLQNQQLQVLGSCGEPFRR